MKVLIKLGGTLLDIAGSRERICAEIAEVSRQVETVIVHGGGKQMTRFLDERGVQSEFVDGLRVSGPEVIDAVLKVFAGSVNHQLVASLVHAGVKAVGLSGLDAALTETEILDPRLGAVGRITEVRPDVLNVLVRNGFVPVVACVGGDAAGNIYNVNADLMAVALAKGYAADQLWFLTDVEGVRDAGGRKIATLTPAGCARLIKERIATGGMQAKLSAATEALAGGVRTVVIAPGAKAGVVQSLHRGEETGTKLALEGAANAERIGSG